MSARISELLGTVFILSIGGYAVVEALGYPAAPSGRMGPAFFPTLFGLLAMGIAIIIAVMVARRDRPVPAVAWRPFLVVMASIAVFCGAAAYLGLVPAAILSVMVAAYADRGTRVFPALAMAVAIAAFSWLIFIVLLGVQIPAFRV